MRIGQAVMLHRGGDRAMARERLGGLWTELGADGDAVQQCMLAHYLAGVQDDPYDALAWDLRALQAAAGVAHEPAVRGFYPALYLRLGVDYARLGRLAEARRELARAQTSAAQAGDGDFAAGVRAGIGRLAARLEAAAQ
ncbi:hypothetical protein G5C51_36380 [Streptomyces sp. A7024]|uniref:Tetratricopeptide repeat protein n=2 Tax=Streptomyces coryli TaxID=1128680 RepID=A0A6G4UBG7_9ACTN|nr:hypothetical protein [Streptomyces coryli]NGN69352.1 hypothetical protein [Streptomyces coryli]